MIKWIKDLRNTEKGKVLFKFILYMTFLIFVMVLCLATGSTKSLKNNSYSRESSGEQKESSLEIPKLSYFDKQKLLVEGKYEFNHTIEISGVKFSFLGVHEDSITEGFKETEGELIHYKIEDGIPYKINFTGKEEYYDLYSGLDGKFFDFESVFKLLNSSSASIEREGVHTTYIYSIENHTYIVKTDEKSIVEIDIHSEENKYIFNFKF